MEKALELLDLMNFRLESTEQFKAKAAEKMFSDLAYDRMIGFKSDVVRRTRQMVEEWMKIKGVPMYGYSLEGDNHTYRIEEKPGRLQVMIKNDPKSPDFFVAKSASWNPGSKSAELTGIKQSMHLEKLLESFAQWADKQFQAQEIVKEVRHYFSNLVFTEKPAYSFVGWPSHQGRLIGTYIRLDVGIPTFLYVEMKNEKK